MNKTWSVVLIVIAVLAVAAGTYWYVEFRPLANQGQTEQATGMEQIQHSNSIQPRILPDSSPSTETEERSQSTESPIQNPPSIPVMKATSQQITEAKHQEIKPMPLPVDPLIASGVFKLPKPRGPVVTIPFALPETVDIAHAKGLLEEKPGIPLSIEEVPKKKEEQEELTLPEAETQTVVLIPRTPSMTSSEVAFDPESFAWSINSSVSFIDYQFPGTVKGFDIQVDLLKRGEGSFMFGGALEYGKVGNDHELSVLGKVQWTFRGDSPLSFPLSISIGPTFLFTNSGGNEFGLTGKIQGGISYALTEWVRVFYEAGVQAQWIITENDFSLQLEPMRIGFGFSF
ncbi:MAG: hypothetical protein ACQ5SW_05535 [Sphaerochaetaceae bacterium]